jgi:hypothetical protein
MIRFPRLFRAVLLGLVHALVPPCFGQMQAPFTPGYSMGNGGTIVWADGMSGRQPWAPAGFYGDSLRFGVALAGIDYYDRMDNLESRAIVHGIAGGWYAFRHVTLKASYQHFGALGMYREQAGFVSAGTDAIPYVSVSVEARGHYVSLPAAHERGETVAELGATLFVPRRLVAFSLSADHFTVKRAHEAGFSRDPSVRVGVHTTRRRVGALGVLFEITPDERPATRFMIGQELWLHRMFGMCASVATDPFLFSFGATFVWSGFGTNVSFVHHPVLGWSRGFMAEYAR